MIQRIELRLSYLSNLGIHQYHIVYFLELNNSIIGRILRGIRIVERVTMRLCCRRRKLPTNDIGKNNLRRLSIACNIGCSADMIQRAILNNRGNDAHGSVIFLHMIFLIRFECFCAIFLYLVRNWLSKHDCLASDQ